MSDLDPTVRALGLKMLKAIRTLRTVLVDRFPASFGGIYNSGDNHNFIVLTVGEDGDLREFVSAYLREATTDDGAVLAQLPTVSFQSAVHPLRSLVDLGARVMAEREELQTHGITVYSAGVRDSHNRLMIMAAPMSDEQRQEVHRRYGVNVEVVATTPPRRS